MDTKRDDKETASVREQRARRATEMYYQRLDENDALAVPGVSSGLIASNPPRGSSTLRDRRRSAILTEATRDGTPLETAELLYDIALEEGLDPALALELVRSGLRVVPPRTDASGPEAPVTDRYLPSWMFPATPPERLELERTFRMSFRRLRSFLESEGEISAAFQRFAAEPDVEHHDD